MSNDRRRGGSEPLPPVKPKKAKPSVKEIQHAQIQQARSEARTFQAVPFPYAKEHAEAYRQREKELLALYKLNPGKCPICSKPVSKGVIGHISKCLRTPTFSSESPTTT